MNDLFGTELEKWLPLEKQIRATMADFGFSEIRTPTLEKIEVFSRTVGDTSDIVEKQMYTIHLPDEVLVLRPEGTASFIRAVIEHQLHQAAGAQHYYYYQPMFRHERPQKGRLRQFHQFGAEIIQDPSPRADAELIAFVDTLFRRLGLSDFRTRINSVGCKACRPAYRELLTQFLKGVTGDLCEQCQIRLERAPMRVLDCKNESCRTIAARAPKIADSLCSECIEHHGGVKSALRLLEIPFENDPSIVRGLDYYVRSAFEFTASQPGALGAQDALGGGGRYDGLAAHFGKTDISGVGFASGMERVILALEAARKLPVPTKKQMVFLAPLGMKAFEFLYRLSFTLKRDGIPAEMSYDSEKGLKNLLKLADKRDATFTVVVGDDELLKSVALIKTMKTGEQAEVPLEGLPAYLKNKVIRET